MAPKVLDEYSLKAREQDIIDATIALIDKDGVENITMDKVVAAVSYSKGTVYKHFLGKEDLFLAIGNQAITIMHDLFSRAAQYEGCPRERMLLLNISYLIYAILHPALFKSVQCAKSPTVFGKSSEKRIQEQEQLEAKMMGTTFSIIEDALKKGQLIIPAHMEIQQVCFATWSQGFGTISLLSSEVEQCSGSSGLVVERELINQSNLLFDGLAWLPLSKDKDYRQSIELALRNVFPSELALLKAMGREFNFG
ncbi:TetR/AcrR family transcriptional regulator [Thalassotalea sp. M1531]|uniref:TetR/AcrR family transcriptional regulator n=1 Tax=Thalassotalea algicola TaxID=2716224 RepID=A0A7Y0Q524_9GAMM|nr:TetR/AcrR family transcriptional regulator [Thalassotalea algicola]NMP30604.1 TetR/AcrR family transcriptional regulator [Thalassotalea algicola]